MYLLFFVCEADLGALSENGLLSGAALGGGVVLGGDDIARERLGTGGSGPLGGGEIEVC